MQSIDNTNNLLELVRKVRKEFLKDYEENKELYFEGDIEKIREDDWYVSRFILKQMKKFNPSIEMLKTSMRWRKEFGIHFLKATDFPQEFYKIGSIFPYEKDREGNAIIYFRLKFYKKISEFQHLFKQYVIYIFNKVDDEVDGRGLAIVFDCREAGIRNMDMDMLWYFISWLNNYYPEGLSYILVYELPLILKGFWNIAMNWLSKEQRKLVKFVKKNEISNFIDQDHLPDFLGGICEKDYRIVPKGCSTAEDIAKERFLSLKVIQKIKETYEHILIKQQDHSN